METHIRKLQRAEIHDINQMLKVRRQVMLKLGLKAVPSIFNIGDEVLFVYGPRNHQYARGVITAEDLNSAYVRTPLGVEYKVSPFALIPLTP